jgi:hypothetical protein
MTTGYWRRTYQSVRYDMRQNRPALYQDQSGVTWGNTIQPYTRTSQVWPEAIPTSLIIPVPFWFGTWGKYKVYTCLIEPLVWTWCLMHRCVCIWQYILQNYNYKLHFQNLSTYHISHVSIGTLAAENLDVCTACDPTDSNIQLTMVNDRRCLS